MFAVIWHRYAFTQPLCHGQDVTKASKQALFNYLLKGVEEMFFLKPLMQKEIQTASSKV